MKHCPRGRFISIGSEVARIARIGEQGKWRCATRCAHAYSTGEGVGSVERTVGLSQHLNGINTDSCDIRKLHAAADRVCRNSVKQHLVGVCASAANGKARRPPPSALSA